MSEHISGRFPTTAWTLLRDAQKLPDEEQRQRARNEFIERYYRPVMSFIFFRIRRAHKKREEAIDAAWELTHGFLLRVLQQDLIAKADRGRGHFRGFLKKNLEWFLADQGPSRVTGQDNFESRLVPRGKLLPDEDRSFEAALNEASNETAESSFDKQWAIDLVNRALRHAEQYCKEEGRPDWWYKAFAAKYPLDLVTKPPSQEKLAQEFGQTRDKVRTALENVENYFIHKLREEVRDQVGSEAELDEEVRELLACLTPPKK